MEKYTLEVQERTERGHATRRNADARIPATVYGQDMEACAVWVDKATFARVFSKVGETAVIEMVIKGAKKPLPTIVRALQYDPLKHTVMHVDFYQVSLKEVVTADVPVVLVGEAPAVKIGGTIIQGTNTVEVRALPNDLPREISVDITTLETFEDSITVADIAVAKNVEVLSDASVLIVGVAAPRVEEKEEEKEEVVSTKEEAATTEEALTV